MSFFFFFSSRRRHTRCLSDWSSDVCSSDLGRSPIGHSKLIVIGCEKRLVASNFGRGGAEVAEEDAERTAATPKTKPESAEEAEALWRERGVASYGFRRQRFYGKTNCPGLDRTVPLLTAR